MTQEKIEVALAKDGSDFTLTVTGEPVGATDLVAVLLNGLVVVAETAVESFPEDTRQKVRDEMYDFLVVSFSAAMLEFNPESKNYKKVTEE